MVTIVTRAQVRSLVDAHDTQSNRSPYRRNPFHRSIDHLRIYLYYFTDPSTQPEPEPRVYIYDHARPLWNLQLIRRKVEALAQNAADGGDDPRPEPGTGFDLVEWTKISLIAIVMDNAAWKFSHDEAIYFVEGNDKEGNHTFFDAFDFDIQLEEPDRRASVVCFTNHMVDASGGYLTPGQREKFKYTLCIRDRQWDALFEIDPGGENVGPPVPPPPE